MVGSGGRKRDGALLRYAAAQGTWDLGVVKGKVNWGQGR